MKNDLFSYYAAGKIVVENHIGTEYNVPIQNGAICSIKLSALKIIC